MSIIAFVLIKTEAGKAFHVVEGVKKIEGVIEAYAITGEYDVIAKVEAADIKELGEKVVTKIHAIDGVHYTVTSIAVT
ncbi:MAG: Lrp/AsnC family transcriptional regulator [Thermoprotei archaeon]|nr:MAG: Lrp/AsnC family transcriptional regulator [Thermoprotei archaeon]